MLRICTELSLKIAWEKLLSFIIYNIKYTHYDKQKETTAVVLFISYIFTKGAKNRTSNGDNLEKFLGGIRIYFVIHLQLESGCYQKRLDLCQVLLAYK